MFLFNGLNSLDLKKIFIYIYNSKQFSALKMDFLLKNIRYYVFIAKYFFFLISWKKHSISLCIECFLIYYFIYLYLIIIIGLIILYIKNIHKKICVHKIISFPYATYNKKPWLYISESRIENLILFSLFFLNLPLYILSIILPCNYNGQSFFLYCLIEQHKKILISKT